VIRTIVSAASGAARTSLATLVRGDARLALVGEAAPSALVHAIDALQPDIVIERRDRDRDGPALRVPSVALVSDPRTAWESERLDTARIPHAILADDAEPEEIVAAAVAIAAGLIAFQARIVTSSAPGPAAGNRPDVRERLTARESDVLAELARGVPNKTIAARLAISEHTVKFHVASIFAKLGVASRTEAVAHGIRLGLVMV